MIFSGVDLLILQLFCLLIVGAVEEGEGRFHNFSALHLNVEAYKLLVEASSRGIQQPFLS